jgi:hypothetical protein
MMTKCFFIFHDWQERLKVALRNFLKEKTEQAEQASNQSDGDGSWEDCIAQMCYAEDPIRTLSETITVSITEFTYPKGYKSLAVNVLDSRGCGSLLSCRGDKLEPLEKSVASGCSWQWTLAKRRAEEQQQPGYLEGYLAGIRRGRTEKPNDYE